MAPVTRSQGRKDAEIAGFPNPPHKDQQEIRKRRPLQPGHELQDSSIHHREPLREGQDVPPRFTIDLSRPPRQRYTEVVLAFKDEIRQLPSIFEDIVRATKLPAHAVTRCARLFLRSLYSNEETEEIRGISIISGIDIHLLVSFNVLLDLFMGCTSGGVRVRENGATRMLHYRTLDWGMDSLRKVIVQLDFVERPGGEVIASTVGYCGFVGVLTGVRKNLSVSLHFRACHNEDDSLLSNLRFYGHHALVLLGLRPSISSVLRNTLLPPSRSSSGWAFLHPKKPGKHLPDISEIMQSLPSVSTTAAYLIFSDGNKTAVFEKDRNTAVIRQSSSFITITNHDVESSEGSTSQRAHAKRSQTPYMQDLIDESEDRKDCIEQQWNRLVKRWRRHRNEGKVVTAEPCARVEDVVKWVEKFPITNESTHYSVVMDARNGKFLYSRRWKEPLSS
ncbi:hypothetical protein K490DRAFT_34449 [Saccharata proteae CBS 121410]|uniref:ceramidase n=1 Tax=Saccharata proteae CBS 121410 TaxID=1314787 RepID=A0A9P4I0B6_9PEZI|nr:hypothetical protein K490DRAFT_34449 [Saccharata proteae CBS 121410]